MPPHFSRNTSYQTANLSDDSIDGLEPPPRAGGTGYGSRQGGNGGLSESEGEEEAEYPTRSHSDPSSRSRRYSNPFSDAGASSGSSAEDEWAAPTAAKKQSSSGETGSSRYGASGYDDEEQVLRSMGHGRRGESEGEGDEEGGGGGGVHRKTRTAKKALKAVRGFAIGQVTKRVKLVCLVVVALLVLVGIMVGIIWYKKHQD